MSSHPQVTPSDVPDGLENRIWQVRDATNARARLVFDAQRGSASWAPSPPKRSIAALRKAVLFLMVKDEADIIGQNLQHHYLLGFRRFFILDNASTDNTAAVVTEFRRTHEDAEIFSAYDFVVGYYQAAKMKALEAFMYAYLDYEDVRPEWLFFVDTDEFITCGLSDSAECERMFEEVLNDASKSLLIFHWVQCASPTVLADLPSDADLFDALPMTWPQMKVEVSKVAYRLGRNLEPIQGNHSVTSYSHGDDTIAVMADLGFYMFHFPMRTVAQLRRKLVGGNKALSATKDRDGLGNTASHWRTYYQWYLESGDAAIVGIIQEHITGCM